MTGRQHEALQARHTPGGSVSTKDAEEAAGQAGAKVTVACKLPFGLIIRGFREVKEQEAVLGGGVRDVVVHRPTGDAVRIRGTAAMYGQRPPLTIGGYAFTYNVSKDLWDQWYKANRDSDLVKRDIVYASETQEAAEGWARDHAGVVTNQEGIDPDHPDRYVRKIQRADRPK
jgi:hypothetical protein